MKDLLTEAITNLLAAAVAVNAQLDALHARYGLTASAFNVLRILRGEPEGQPRGRIAQRLIHRAPDVTRLIDRLERRGLVKRVRTRADRRLSVTQITPKGLELLARIEPVLEEYRTTIAARLSPSEWKELSRLCERINLPKD